MKYLLARLLNWKSTTSGAAIGAFFIAILKSLDCQLPDDWIVYGVGILPVIHGILSKDK